jgi:hypothetical protein
VTEDFYQLVPKRQTKIIDVNATTWPPKELIGYATIDGYAPAAGGPTTFRVINRQADLDLDALAILGPTNDFQIDAFRVEYAGGTYPIQLTDPDLGDVALRQRVLRALDGRGPCAYGLWRCSTPIFANPNAIPNHGALEPTPIFLGSELVITVSYNGAEVRGRPFRAFALGTNRPLPMGLVETRPPAVIELTTGSEPVTRVTPSTLRINHVIVRGNNYLDRWFDNPPIDVPKQVVFLRLCAPAVSRASWSTQRDLIVGIADENDRVVLTIDRNTTNAGAGTAASPLEPRSYVQIRYEREGLNLAEPYFDPVRAMLGIP